MDQQPHEMILEETYPSGTEEWYCPLCDRRLLVMNWHPDGKRIILNLGDELSHSNKEQRSLPETESTNESVPGADDAARLAIWRAWLDKVDFENRWTDPTG